MTNEEFGYLKNPDVFMRDYLGRPLLTDPDILAKTKASIVHLMDDVVEALKPCNATVVIHCLWEPKTDNSPHVANSRHFEGIACDFHIAGNAGYFGEIRTLETVLDTMKVSHAVGLGLYPEWNNKGFHLDTRGVKARWGQKGGQYVGYDVARNIAERM